MEADNPFKPPAAELTNPLPGANLAPLYKLAGVALATFIGSPLAGGYLIGRNLNALGRRPELSRAWGITIAIFLVCNALTFFSPSGKATFPLAIAQVVGMYFFAQYLLGPALVLRAEQGGPFYSNWRAVGIGLLFCVGIIAAMVAVVVPMSLLGLIDLS